VLELLASLLTDTNTDTDMLTPSFIFLSLAPAPTPTLCSPTHNSPLEEKLGDSPRVNVIIRNENMFCDSEIATGELSLNRLLDNRYKKSEYYKLAQRAELQISATYLPPLEITLHYCKNLPDIQLVGTQDPYVRVSCDSVFGPSQVKTRTDEDGHKSPKWEHKFTFALKVDPRTEAETANLGFTFEVMNENILHDSLIGKCRLRLQEAISMATKRLDKQALELRNEDEQRVGNLYMTVTFPKHIYGDGDSKMSEQKAATVIQTAWKNRSFRGQHAKHSQSSPNVNYGNQQVFYDANGNAVQIVQQPPPHAYVQQAPQPMHVYAPQQSHSQLVMSPSHTTQLYTVNTPQGVQYVDQNGAPVNLVQHRSASMTSVHSTM
jgi:C2 domain